MLIGALQTDGFLGLINSVKNMDKRFNLVEKDGKQFLPLVWIIPASPRDRLNTADRVII